MSERIDSPTLAAQTRRSFAAISRVRAGISYEAVDDDQARAGAQLAFGAACRSALASIAPK